jgi:hypothetical protein
MHDSAMHACPDSSRKLRRKMSRCQSTCRQHRVSLINSIHWTSWRFSGYREGVASSIYLSRSTLAERLLRRKLQLIGTSFRYRLAIRIPQSRDVGSMLTVTYQPERFCGVVWGARTRRKVDVEISDHDLFWSINRGIRWMYGRKSWTVLSVTWTKFESCNSQCVTVRYGHKISVIVTAEVAEGVGYFHKGCSRKDRTLWIYQWSANFVIWRPYVWPQIWDYLQCVRRFRSSETNML